MMEVKIEEIRQKVLDDISVYQNSASPRFQMSKIEYLLNLHDRIQDEGWSIIDGDKVVTDKFLGFLLSLTRDPSSKPPVYSLTPITREELLTVRHPYKMKPLVLQADDKYYYVRYVLDNVDIAKMAVAPMDGGHFVIDFFEFDPRYSSSAFLTDVIKDALTSEFGISSFEVPKTVFGVPNVSFEGVNTGNV